MLTGVVERDAGACDEVFHSSGYYDLACARCVHDTSGEMNGDAEYIEDPKDEQPLKFKLTEKEAAEIFGLASKLDNFKRPLESGLKVANMGQKTLRWEAGGDRGETKFNYSSSEDAKLLTDRFERISESLRTLLELRRAARHDRLGVNAAVLKIQSLWDNRRLVATAQFLPLLDQVAKDEAYIHMARERAAQIADAIRATAK